MPQELNEINRQRFEREIRNGLDAISELPEQVRTELKKHPELFLDAVSTLRHGVQHHTGNPGWRWVIRNDHLDFVAAVSPVAIGLATYATTVANTNPAGLAVTLIASALAVVRKLGAKTSWLETDEFSVLMALKKRGPCISSIVVEELNGIPVTERKIWSVEQVEQILNLLTTVRLRDGTIEAFVVRPPDGLWSTNGI